MSITSEGMTPADIAAVTNNNGNNDAWGGNWSSWIILFLIFAVFGGRGFGFSGYGANEGGGSGAVVDNYVLSSDFGQVERKLDGIANGICDSTYALNNTITNGFAAAQNTMTQGFAGLNTGIVTQGYENRNAIQNAQVSAMQSANAIQTQLAQCCCDNKSAIADVKYSMAMNANNTDRTIDAVNYNLTTQASGIGRQLERGFADTNYNMATNTCNITQEIHKVGDRIIEYMVNDKNQTLRDENQALRLSASQSAQNNYLISQLRPQPSPAYVVPNPYCNCNNGCGCNSGCGC